MFTVTVIVTVTAIVTPCYCDHGTSFVIQTLYISLSFLSSCHSHPPSLLFDFPNHPHLLTPSILFYSFLPLFYLSSLTPLSSSLPTYPPSHSHNLLSLAFSRPPSLPPSPFKPSHPPLHSQPTFSCFLIPSHALSPSLPPLLPLTPSLPLTLLPFPHSLGWVKVSGPTQSGKSSRVLTACHTDLARSKNKDFVWVDLQGKYASTYACTYSV